MVTIDLPSAADLQLGAWRWPHIDPAKEWACKGTGRLFYVPSFLDMFEELRQRCGFALPITSGYRSPEHNAETSETGLTGPHTTGLALDLHVTNPELGTVIHHALTIGFLGFGVCQKSGSPILSRFLHLDIARSTLTFWSY